MKRFLKGALLIVLFVAVIVLAAIPAKSASYVEMPGIKGGGKFGDSCICPMIYNFNCGCIIIDPNQ